MPKPILTLEKKLSAELSKPERKKLNEARDVAVLLATIRPEFGQPIVEAIDKTLVLLGYAAAPSDESGEPTE